MPEGTFLVRYADNLAAIIIARNVDKTQFLLNQAVHRVGFWAQERGLDVASQKTEIVLLTMKRITTLRSMKVGNVEILTQKAAMYLGVTLDNKLTFGEQIARAADKVANITSILSRLMANSSDSQPCKGACLCVPLIR